MKAINITNQKFGRLTVVQRIGIRGKKTLWQCICDCGNIHNATIDTLKGGRTRSCGCLHHDSVKAMHLKHGFTKDGKTRPEYMVWAQMRKRCSNPKDNSYKNYGERGIKVCNRWREFKNFIQDMGIRPSEKYSIERKNVNGDYKPSNCFWATREEQSANRRTNRNITFNGQTFHIAKWAKVIGISQASLSERLGSHNWTFEDAMSTPKVFGKKRKKIIK